MIRVVKYLCIAIVVVGCVSGNASKIDQKEDTRFKQVAISKLGSEELTFTMNESKAYVLCVKEIKGTAQQPRNNLSFVVIKVADNSLILEEKVEGGTVKWFNEKEIEVFRTPGIMRDDQSRDDFTMLYNVETGKASSKQNRTVNQ